MTEGRQPEDVAENEWREAGTREPASIDQWRIVREDREKLANKAKELAESICKKDPEMGKQALEAVIHNYGVAIIHSRAAQKQGRQEDHESWNSERLLLESLLVALGLEDDNVKAVEKGYYTLARELLTGIQGRVVRPNESAENKG